MIFEPTDNPIKDALTEDIHSYLSNLWNQNTRGFMYFMNDLTGKKWLDHPRLWIRGQKEIREKITSKKRITSLCFCNARFEIFILADAERVLDEEALREYVTFFATNSNAHPTILVFVDDEHYDIVSARIDNIKQSNTRPDDEYCVFVIKTSQWEKLLEKSEDYGSKHLDGVTAKEQRSSEIAEELFAYINNGTLTDEILDNALAQDIDVDFGIDYGNWRLLDAMCYSPLCTPKMLEKLIKAGADVNDVIPGEGGLFIADAAKSETLLKYGANVNQQTSDGCNALLASLPCCDANKTRVLIEHGIDVNHCDNTGMSSLMQVTDVQSAQLLLDNGADINAVDKFGNNVIDAHCTASSVDVIKFLLKNGAPLSLESALVRIAGDEELLGLVRDKIKSNDVQPKKQNPIVAAKRIKPGRISEMFSVGWYRAFSICVKLERDRIACASAESDKCENLVL